MVVSYVIQFHWSYENNISKTETRLENFILQFFQHKVLQLSDSDWSYEGYVPKMYTFGFFL
jgi:hypothetical protein